MKTALGILAAAASIVLIGATVLAQSGSDLFARALVEEKTGSYERAIVLYRTVVEQHGSDKKLAARALLQMGGVYEKLGRLADARGAYERLARDLSDQKAIARDATPQLARLAAGPPIARTDGHICSDCGDWTWTSISADGRLLAFDRDGDLFVRDNENGTVQTILKDPSDVTRFPLISPDGRRIAYVRLWENGDETGHDLRVVENKPAATPRIVNDNPQYIRVIPAAWESDGNSLLAVIHMEVDSTWTLARVSTSDGSVTPIKSIGWRFAGFDAGRASHPMAEHSRTQRS